MAEFINVAQALELVKSGCHIIASMGAVEPQDFLSSLHTVADRVKDVTITNCLPLLSYKYSQSEYRGSFFCESLFYSPVMRKAHEMGNSSYIPNHLHQCGVKRNFYRNADIYVGAASLPDKHGYVSLSLSNIYEKRSIENASIVILEINPNVPRTFGDVEINLSDVDYVIRSDYELPTLPFVECTDKDMIIGRMIAERIDDGDCIQLGIGGIPNAVAKSLMDKKDLGVHTEMLTTGIMDLAKAGVVTGKHKQIHKDRIVTSFIMGSKELYDFVDDNPSVRVFDCNYVNDPDVILIRDYNIRMNEEQRKLIARINKMFGNLIFVSDDVSRYDDKQWETYNYAVDGKQVEIKQAYYLGKNDIYVSYVEDGQDKEFIFDVTEGIIMRDK